MSTTTARDKSLSVVVVNWNAGPHLLACVRSLHEHPPSIAWDVVIVDNASTDGSVDAAVQAFPATAVIRNATNRGLAAANNQGIAATTGSYVLISNPDVRYLAGAVDALVDVLERHPDAAFAVPRLLYDDGAGQTSAGDLPTLREALLGRRALRRTSATSGFWWDGWAHDEERAIGRGHESAYLVRRTAIAAAGPQDERYPLDWEGIEWARRMHGAGFEIWFTPAARVVHVGGVSLRQAKARWIVGSHRGLYRYFAAGHPWRRAWLAPVVAVRGLAKLVEARFTDSYERAFRRRSSAAGRPADH